MKLGVQVTAQAMGHGLGGTRRSCAKSNIQETRREPADQSLPKGDSNGSNPQTQQQKLHIFAYLRASERSSSLRSSRSLRRDCQARRQSLESGKLKTQTEESTHAASLCQLPSLGIVQL